MPLLDALPLDPEDEEAGVDDGVFEPEAGGEDPHPARARAMTAVAAASSPRGDLKIVVVMSETSNACG
jgi:hypothetical protein